MFWQVPTLFIQKLPHMLFPVLMFLFSLPQFSCSLLITPPLALKILHLYSVVVRQTQPIMLHCSRVEESPSSPDPFLSLWSGQFRVLLEFTRSSHLHCVPEFTQPVDNGGREYQWHNCSRLRRQRGSWKTVSTGGRRGGGCAASLILHHKHQSTLCLQNAAEKLLI